MRQVRRLLQAVSRLFSWLAGIFVLALMLLVVAEVVARDAFQTTLGGTIEVSEVLLVFLVFLGLGYAQQDRSHVSTDLVTSRLGKRPAAVARALGLVVAAMVLLAAAWATAGRGWDSMLTGEARFGLRSVPVWPARLLVPVGLVLLAAESMFAAWDVWQEGHVDGAGESTDREGTTTGEVQR